jgi:preprotein translocase subunit SecA
VRDSRLLALAQGVLAQQSTADALSSDACTREVARIRAAFRVRRETQADLLLGLALLRRFAREHLGQTPYPVQLAGALGMHQGVLIEMATGEGKTLTAALAATLAGWRGEGCHVITVNDYLAQRDASWMEPVYARCGLSVASIHQLATPTERRKAYHADITYTTNKEVAADYLRDQLALRGVLTVASLLTKSFARGEGLTQRDDPTTHLVMRGLACAIVDEADSILIDEAVTPLIIAGLGSTGPERELYPLAQDIASQLVEHEHYRIDRTHREITLTPGGQRVVASLVGALLQGPHAHTLSETSKGILAGPRRREEFVRQALTARELFLLGKHYVVQQPGEAASGGAPQQPKVVIVDEFTGRLMPDRQWRDGLHEAICAKESLPIAPPQTSLARVSFQRFFRMYARLSGMSGTAQEERRELWRTYSLPVCAIPRNKPRRFVALPTLCFATISDRLRFAISEAEAMHRMGRPVLIGTRSVATSQTLSRMLDAKAIPHTVLNALHHEQESQIIERAGELRAVTVATNMAGRGTDIRLGDGAEALGGLHVIATEMHESARIDRQLLGRAGRQGDQGSGRVLLSLEDELVQRFASALARTIARSPLAPPATSGSSAPWVRLLARTMQRRAQSLARTQRTSVLKQDEWLADALGFAGPELGLSRAD